MKRSSSRIFLLASLLVPLTSYAQLQGKMFTTPEQRAYLDALRRDFLADSRAQGFNIEDSEVPPLPDENSTRPPERVEYTLSGIMTRRDGSHVIWLNNRSYTESELPDGIALANTNNALALRFRTNTGDKLLLPGQTIEINSGVVQERYQRTAPPTPAPDANEAAKP